MLSSPATCDISTFVVLYTLIPIIQHEKNRSQYPS